MPYPYQTIVIGLGAAGSATAYQLAKRGNKVLGIDQFTPPHKYGSSHGESRVTRQAIGEGPEFVPWVLRSYEIWNEIERESGKQVLTITGGLILTSADQSIHHGSQFFNQTVAMAERFGIAHTLLDARDIQARYPQFKLQGNEKGYFEDQAGYLRPELCIEVQLELAQRYGAQLSLHEKVLELSGGDGDSVLVKTERGTYEAGHVILSAGAWLPEMLGEPLSRLFKVYRQVAYWFEVSAPVSRFEAPHFPIWIWEFGMGEEDIVYGFPVLGAVQGGVKIASETYRTTTHPESVFREVSDQEKEDMYQRYVAPHFDGLGKRCIQAQACLYTVTPDFKFVIDSHPEFPRVMIVSPCSGHGFKHSAAIGEALAQLITDGHSDLDLSPFSIRRFAERL